MGNTFLWKYEDQGFELSALTNWLSELAVYPNWVSVSISEK